MTALPPIPPDRAGALAWVAAHLIGLFRGRAHASDIVGGQQAADAAVAGFDVTGYARRRNEVWPESRRGASGLSPYIRHGLLSLPRVWSQVVDGPAEDVAKFRDELRWQEYARHLYARLGDATRRSLRFSVLEHGDARDNPWESEAACLSLAYRELTERGWLPNQERMWLASHWAVRSGLGWRDGEDLFFRLLLDGSRAANRAGWQWTVGALGGKAYGFSRWQVEKRAPGLCATCVLQEACPVQDWPPVEERDARPLVDPRIRRDDQVEVTAGPGEPVQTGEPEVVWITAESLGDDDPALAAHPNLPVAFVFDEALLARLRLESSRLVFLSEALADLAQRRDVEVWRGDPVRVLAGRAVATTFAPVPGWRSRAQAVRPVVVHPWPWLVRPHAGSLTSFTAWGQAAVTGFTRAGRAGGDPGDPR
jgi:deoxyribodipyrimidine photo-lyase